MVEEVDEGEEVAEGPVEEAVGATTIVIATIIEEERREVLHHRCHHQANQDVIVTDLALPWVLKYMS